MSAHINFTANPGLAPYDISAYTGVAGANFFAIDPLLQKIVERYSSDCQADHKAAMLRHLADYGALCGGILNELTIASHQEGQYGEIVQYDRTGKRIEAIVYCKAQTESRRISYEHGIINLDQHADWPHPFTMLHKMALAYLANQNGEGGMTCPLAMTDGMIDALRNLGTPEQQARYLPLIAGEGSDSHFMCGQYVTERVGGSNVGQNRTVARKQADGTWILNGEKWFCSNPGDLWVTTARIEDTSTIGMFLVPRIKADGELNGCYHLRKKDIIGSRGKITVECVYQDLVAEELGRPGHGLANLIKYVIQKSRIHVAVSAIGTSRRAFIEARAYVQEREAYGGKVIRFPIVRRTLAEMQIRHSAVTWATFKNYMLLEQKHAASQILTPLLKYISTVHATWITHEAIILHGGNGIIGDFSVLPRLHNDSIINETWEGTHHIITDHVLKAALRPRIQTAYLELIDQNLAAAGDSGQNPVAVEVQRQRDLVQALLQKDSGWQDLNRVYICDEIYYTFALSELAANHSDPFLWACARGFFELHRQGSMGATDSDSIFQSDVDLELLIQT
ncbi:MAG: acyl-CoA dehydrogenase family protein [Leptospiraceae bacterium]|nr:acyl-CoA dehydrogenase family protein [Leptospiraceae bacterium]